MGIHSGRERKEVVVVVVVFERRSRKERRRAERELLFLAQVMTSCGALRAP
jgi:hypothetical protein